LHNLITELNEPSDKTPCIQCGDLITINNRFCNYCGAAQYIAPREAFSYKLMLMKQAGFYYAIDLLVCILAFFDTFHGLSWLICADAIMAFTAVAFFAYDWQRNKEILKWKSFSFIKLLGFCTIAVTAQVLVHYSVNWLNLTVYSKDVSYYSFYASYDYGKILLIMFTAVFPALFEELGYRGYLLQTLSKITDDQQAVYISAFLFAIIHLSLLSLFWLIPFALFLGFIRVREKTIWYGVFFHFCFNLTACLFELL